MAVLKIILIGSLLLASAIASAKGKHKDTDDLLLEDLNSPSQMQVSLKSVNHESEAASAAMLAHKYKQFKSATQIQPRDGMIVAFKPARR